jgi:hypothetical protein
MGNISFGDAFVAGKNLVPSPAAGNIAFFILFSILILAYHYTTASVKQAEHVYKNNYLLSVIEMEMFPIIL